MENQLNVRDLLAILKQYREELANVMEQKTVFKVLLEKQTQHIQELERQLAELRQQDQNERANE